MTWSPDDEGVARSVRSLSPYLANAVGRAAEIALRLHAEAVSLEHVLLAVLDDEDSGAHQLIVHAFADPETLHAEVMALSPGILVVGSGRSLPFSIGGVNALYRALARAFEREGSQAGPSDLLAAGLAGTDAEIRSALEQAGLAADTLRGVPNATERPSEASPFARFDMPAKRALARACRAAVEFERPSISPAHLVLGALDSQPDLAREVGLTGPRARMVLYGRDADPEPTPDRALAAEPELARFLGTLPAGASSAQLLASTLRDGPEGLRLLLVQQRITEDLLARSAEAFDDPTLPAGPGSI